MHQSITSTPALVNTQQQVIYAAYFLSALTFSLPLLFLFLFPQALYTNSSIDERGEPTEEEEDHTYELLLTAQTKVPQPSQESQSHKGNCVLHRCTEYYIIM